MSDQQLTESYHLRGAAWNRYRWFFKSIPGWDIYCYQTTELQPERLEAIKATNPDLYQQWEDDFMWSAEYFEHCIEPSIRFQLWLQLSRLAFKLFGPSRLQRYNNYHS